MQTSHWGRRVPRDATIEAPRISVDDIAGLPLDTEDEDDEDKGEEEEEGTRGVPRFTLGVS